MISKRPLVTAMWIQMAIFPEVSVRKSKTQSRCPNQVLISGITITLSPKINAFILILPSSTNLLPAMMKVLC